MKTIDIERMRSILDYDPGTGIFKWKVKPGRNIPVGAIAGGSGPGYRDITIDGVRIGAHRLAFAYVHGYWPDTLIDHRDGVKSNNRIDNLRVADRSRNALNLHRPVRAASGHRGVYQIKGRSTFFASFAGKHLGSFPVAADAAAAYAAAKNHRLLSTGGI